MKKIILTIITTILLAPLSMRAESPAFIDYGRASNFIDIDAHLMFGGSYVTNNYSSCYKEVSDINSTMGFAYGIGATVKFNFSNFIGLGTQFNYLLNKNKMDLVVTQQGAPNVSNVFIRNSYRYVDIPIYLSFTFNLASQVKWNADGGLYLAFGTGGKQKTTIYNAKVNDLGQLLTTTQHLKAGYFDDDKAFINSYEKFDMGLHLGTGLTFYNRISLNVFTHIGCRNAANSSGLVKPSAHNFNVFCSVGYFL
jgi:hypothetical protein